MWIFDFFKKKRIAAKNIENKSAITITSTEHGSHGNHYGGLLGFQLLHSEKAPESVYQLIQYVEEQSQTMQ